MNIVKIWNGKASERQLREIAARIEAGELAIIPTDTMYAIAGDALNQHSIERICKIKGINPDKQNLSIICADISMAAEYSRIDNRAFKLLKENCPGPFTFLFRCNSNLPKAFKGRKTVGIRIPDNDFDRELSRTLGHPLISTSIQYRDEDYAVNPELIAEEYEGKVELIAEGEPGTTDVSTVVDCTDGNPEIIREGLGELIV